MTGRRIAHLVLLATVAATGCCHPAPADPTTAYINNHPVDGSMPDYDYYTGSDAENDYYTILDRSGKVIRPFATDRDPKMWPTPMPRTADRTLWRLVPGSSAP